jgi:uncharacterized protein DUF885
MSLLARLAAVRDLMIAGLRETVGMHEYDGVVQDLSASSVARGLSALAPAGTAPEPGDDEHDAAHVASFETGLRWKFGEYQAHRRDPLLHFDELDLACYDRLYAPEPARAAARARHLEQWPEVVDVAVTTLDQVPAPVAQALLPAARGLAAALDTPGLATGATIDRARAAHARLTAHLEHLAAHGDPDCSVGRLTLAQAMSAFEGYPEPIDVGAVAEEAAAETARLQALLTEACARIDAHRPVAEVVAALQADHPGIDGVISEAQTMTLETLAFTAEHRLVPWTDGECLVGPAPESRKWAMAMMSWAGPEEADAPSWYHVTPPEPDWPPADIEEWLAVFSRTTLPAVTVHEVSPGHYAHSRALRRLSSPVRRQLIGATFAEGWAHYTEEMMIECGFRSGDPRYVVGVCLEALVRSTRLTCSIGLHTGALDVAGATERFRADAYLGGSAARSEANRGSFDIGYGRYTLGKLAILRLREQAVAAWGPEFSLPRWHAALLDLGSPPLGLIRRAVSAG